MKAIVNGKRYDTETARFLCALPGPHNSRDFAWDDTSLYRTSKGAYFIAGEGGPMSRWAQRLGCNEWSGGSGLKPVDAEEARSILEQAGAVDILEELFDFEEA